MRGDRLRLAACLPFVVFLGCASQAPVKLPPVGPMAAASTQVVGGAEAASTGTLLVYSEELPAAKHRNPPVYSHTGYVVRRPSGELVAQVDNRSADVEADPEEVPLPAGLYEVRARCAKVGTVVVPVVIAPGQRTELFLDASGMPAAQARALTDPVKLYDGRVVGARAAPTEAR